ncbi:MAG TPA: glycosyl hydrolase, partial [Polyangia bacterium]
MPRIFLALTLLVAARAGAVEVGLSGPSVYNGDVDGALAGARAVEATGTIWARLNFRLDVWSAPDDATRRGPQQLTWYEAYDRLVDELTTHGVQVYGQVGAESVPGGGEPDSDDHVQRYAAAFVKIADHFRDRVRVFETFNEPNNWRDAKSMRPAVAPLYYAKELQEIYLNTKYYNNRSQDPCAQVAIVSGALFSSEATNAADYWNQVVDAGRSQLAWDWMQQHVGSWPYDGVGYHIYVGQGAAATTSSVASATQANLDGIWAAVTARDADAAQKKLWLTEFGWTIDQVSATQQAQFLTASFDTYAANGNVAAAFWFTYQDFPGGRYGLYDGGGLAVGNRRPDYDAFTAAVAKHAPALAARFVADDVPPSLAPGETRTVTLTVHNAGSATWSEAAKERLGAAPGCPSAAAKNALLFVPGASGYANSVDDARVLL